MIVTGAIPYDSDSADLGGFVEVIRPGAFRESLADAGRDVLALQEHDSRLILGRRSTRTLKLEDGRSALRYSVDLPPTGAGRDVEALLERRDLNASSFAFTVPTENDERWTVRPDGVLQRELLRVQLHDVSIVSVGAYPKATASTRVEKPAGVSIDVLRLRNRISEM